ncbi:fatty acid desaturase [Paraflavitalea sp. CAU 1676]|uniref:fatty acid desaturase family protein n=1 Tax=Paraflavitalea sp. CAU 1676 TaxID=3032598 RepID=UPI0023DC9546|nr:fatty acid desaturase [Paraflavitalea sp. CAU 1676]MDF2190777.1 fatty acid desaturase [Paraflavitalea sp. CAU 1676]
MEKVSRPQYTKSGHEAIFHQLRQEVGTLVAQLEPKRKPGIMLKALLFPILYILVYTSILLWGNNPVVLYAGYIGLGVLLVVIFLNIIHDAVHGTVFRSKQLNEWYVYLFDLMGANSYTWRMRHVRFHHNYPNVSGWDTDIEQSKLARIFPSDESLRVHRFQHIYLPLLYPLYLLNWLLIRDFRDFFDKNRTICKLTTIPRKEYLKLFLFKGLFLFYLIVLPLLLLNVGWGRTLTGFLLMMFTASIFSLIVLLSPHANTSSEFPEPDHNNQLPYNWMMHMLKTTNDVQSDNWFTRSCMGCFNFHVVHHLFPNVNHVYYPEVTSLLKQYAARYDLPYRSFPLGSSLKKHFLLLKRNGEAEDIFEETM